MKILHQLLLLLLLSSLVLLSSCQDPAPKCKYASPTPLFDANSPIVAEHNFSSKEMESTETIEFKDNLSMKVYQSGCNSLSQEYHFILHEPIETYLPSSWIEVAANKFDYVSAGGTAILPIGKGLSRKLQAEKESMRVGETYELVDMGVSLKIDQVVSDGRFNVIVTMKELEK